MLAVSLLKLCKLKYKSLRIFDIQFYPQEIVDEKDQQFIIVWDFDVERLRCGRQQWQGRVQVFIDT